MVEDFEYKVGRLELHADDILVLKVNSRISAQTADNLRSYCRKALGDRNRKILVLEQDLDVSILTVPELEARMGVAVDAGAIG